MNIKTASAIMALVTFPFMSAMPVLADSDNKPVVSVTAKAQAKEKDELRIKNLKAKADREIDRRIKALNNLMTRISNIKQLSVDDKSKLSAQVQVEITSLNALKAKIDADTDITILKSDVSSIIKSYRIFALFIPKMMIIAHADRLLELETQMAQLTKKLQTLIDEAKKAGKDITLATSLMTDRTNKLSDAKAKAQGAIDAVLPLTPDGFPNNKSILYNARTMLQTARHDLRDAHKDAQQIKINLRLKGEIKITPAP